MEHVALEPGGRLLDYRLDDRQARCRDGPRSLESAGIDCFPSRCPAGVLVDSDSRALFALGFFAIHFGGFHYVHSQLMISFFPIDTGGAAGSATDAGMSTYAEIMRRYWTFLPAAFLAERAAFMRKPLSLELDVSLAAARSAKHARVKSVMWEPYRSVARMHMLIFFFFFAHFARLENFAVYAVVYAVYFFPWRLVRRSVAEPTLA